MNTFSKSTSLALLASSVLLLGGAPAQADGPSYSYIDAFYQDVSIDAGGGLDVDGDGFAVAGSVAINDNWFVLADYSSTDFEGVLDLNQISVGGGYNSAISERTDWFATLSYLDAELDGGFLGNADDSGYGVALGIRSMLRPNLEVNAQVGYADLGAGADGTTFGGGVWWTVAGNFALGAQVDFDDDFTALGLGVRLYFDK